MIPLLEIAREQTRFNDDKQARKLGEALFDCLFNDVLRQDFVTFYYKVVQQEKQLLRVELDIDEREMPEIAALPWEFLCLPESANLGEIWLGTDPNSILTRRCSQWHQAPAIQLKPGEKLRIALAISAPQNLGAVVYEKVQGKLEKLAIEQSDRIELLPIVNPATREDIDTLLEQEPHIFHFIGHGCLHDESGAEVGQIALVDNVLDEALQVNASFFGGLLNRHRPSVVMVQACEGGRLSASQAFVGVASKIVQQNIPVVVAMQYEVSNVTANRFADRFYERLAKDDPVDLAVQNGRYSIALDTQYRKRDFATPVIFMRVRDGYLFPRQGEDVEPEPSPSPSPYPSPSPSPYPSPNPQTRWWIVLGAIAFLVLIIPSVMSRRNQPLKNIPQPTPSTPVLTEVPSVDYTDLEKTLQQGRWEIADSNTSTLMLTIGDRDTNGKLYETGKSLSDEIDNFPCSDLQKINELWVRYSNGKFGFSIQKEIYLSLEGENKSAQETWNAFIEQGVGWHNGEKWLPYNESIFNIYKAPKGHLPRLKYIDYKEGLRYIYFKDKLESCNL